jgi:hypothetical protein
LNHEGVDDTETDNTVEEEEMNRMYKLLFNSGAAIKMNNWFMLTTCAITFRKMEYSAMVQFILLIRLYQK